jgi:hypothetical protein
MASNVQANGRAAASSSHLLMCEQRHGANSLHLAKHRPNIAYTMSERLFAGCYAAFAPNSQMVVENHNANI